MYTNMFESVLHSEPPWYVGHMYHSKEEGISSSEDSNNNLVTAWDDDSDDNKEAGGKVLGTILRIVDYRRFEDGRLLLLVQGMERFTVVDVVQQLPYGVANVQLIPDLEEVDDGSDWTTKRTEEDVAAARGLAISDSFNKWYRYEYENTLLPLPLKEEIKTEDVVGGAIAKVLPYAPYSSVVKVEQVLREEEDDDESDISRLAIEAKEADCNNNSKQNNTTLEYRLIQSNILCEPPTTRLYQKLSCDELEIRLWVAINDHLKKTKKAVSPVLLGFLPHNVDWDSAAAVGGRGEGGVGSGFLLEQIAKTLEAQTQLESKFVRMPPEYPALRRQKRFSYSVAALLEEIDTVNDFRRILLTISSTKQRMVFILQMLEPEYDDDDEWGVFQ